MKIPDEILTIARNLQSQDNRATAIPLFLVERANRHYGVHRDFADGHVWFEDGYFEEITDPAEVEKLDEAYKKDDALKLEGFERRFYKDSWDFVTACLTEQGCKDYLACNGHNLGKTRIYVATGYRNKEIEALRDFLLTLPHNPEVERPNAENLN